MTLAEPQKIISKENNNQNNFEHLSKMNNLDFKLFFTQNSFSVPLNNFNFQNQLSNKLKKDEFSKEQKPNNHYFFQTTKTPQITQNINANPPNQLNDARNHKEVSSLNKNFESLYNVNYINNNSLNLMHHNNQLIEPIFYNGPNDLNNYVNDKDALNKPYIKLNHNLIDPNQNHIQKKRNIFNKFKVFRMEPRKEREKIAYKLKHKRKYKPDDIRKKIKARFHKSIKNIVNENLRQAGSKHTFSFLPQIFISSISREQNHKILNLSYRDLLKKDFISSIDESKYKNKRVDLAKYKNNLNVLDYLDKNPDICEKSGFDLISRMKYGDLLEEYFRSCEFENAVRKLREENEEEDYIKEYINKAKTYVKFFSEIPFKINKKKIKKKNESIAIEIKGNEEADIEKEKDKENIINGN